VINDDSQNRDATKAIKPWKSTIHLFALAIKSDNPLPALLEA
jgi:hypothetical protein